MIVISLSFLIVLPAEALDWDGDSSGGGGSGVDTNIKGFSIRFTDNQNMLGYRFSVIDRSGNIKSNKIIDVFRKTSAAPYANKACGTSYYKFSTKRNKKQLIENQNGSFSTKQCDTNCYKESEMGFDTELPDPDKMYLWQANSININVILNTVGIGNINNLIGGDKVLVEPIYDVRLEGDYHALTVTETAVYGKHLLGADSDGGISYTAEKWGFISRYVNQHYPNSLYTPDGQGLWESASPSTERIKFKYIINKGYGVGIAYTNDKDEFSPTLSVNECRAYKGTLPTKTYQYGTSIGNVFANWKYVSGYPVSGDTVFFSVNFPKEDENTYVKQTVWIDGTQVGTRKGYSDDLEWYDVKPTSATVTSSKAYYTVKARVDWIDSSGKTKIEGAEKTFYIPVKPIITREKVSAYNEENKVQAYSGKDGSSGKLYFGQKVTFGYNYGAETTWDSYNNVEAVSYRWNGSSWAHIYNSSTGSQDV